MPVSWSVKPQLTPHMTEGGAGCSKDHLIVRQVQGCEAVKAWKIKPTRPQGPFQGLPGQIQCEGAIALIALDPIPLADCGTRA